MSPQRIQLRRTKGWTKPPGAVVVSRPSKWGNPFRVTRCSRVECVGDGPWCVTEELGLTHIVALATETAARSFAVGLFAGRLHDVPGWRDAAIEKLAGKDLACWCPLSEPCHADVLLEIANGAGL